MIIENNFKVQTLVIEFLLVLNKELALTAYKGYN